MKFMTSKELCHIVVVLSLVCSPLAIHAGPLVDAYNKARVVDPLYLSALAERDGNVMAAQLAGAAYYPQLKISSSQLENEGGGSEGPSAFSSQ